MGYLTLHCGIPCIALWDTLSHDPAQQSIQMESCDSLALGLRRSAMDCAGAAQVFPHRRFNRATACEAYDAIWKPGLIRNTKKIVEKSM